MDDDLLRFASQALRAQLARVLDDGDNFRVVPMVTRGPFENVDDLLHLSGVDAAIVNGDILEQLKKERKIANIGERVNYMMPLFPAEVHVFVRPEIARLEDLAGKPVNFNTAGTAAAYSGPIIFERLGIKVQPRFVPHPTALTEMKDSDTYAAVVFVSSKPLDPFVKGQWPAGFKFVPVPFTDQLEDYYVPAEIDAADYPGLIPEGQRIQTIAVPTVLVVFNWPSANPHSKRVARFVDYLFDRFPRLQSEPGYHAKWADLNLAGTVPGWQRSAPMQDRLAKATHALAAETAEHPDAQRAAGLRPVRRSAESAPRTR
ncbi:MAG TPA: C4-dicarboxylate ABC transporter substrate-binding protein [Xanthobacteraceae bacterium]|nr:C4-dicarboxylate ABC transporter substrate-binding protein [Xanthobacteraceae bacterium]